MDYSSDKLSLFARDIRWTEKKLNLCVFARDIRWTEEKLIMGMRTIAAKITDRDFQILQKRMREKGITMSEVIREFIRSGDADHEAAMLEHLKNVERRLVDMNIEQLFNYLHDLLRIVIKNDMVLHHTVVRDHCKTKEEIAKFYEPILKELEERGFIKPLMGRKE